MSQQCFWYISSGSETASAGNHGEREQPNPELDTVQWEDNNLLLSGCLAVALLSKSVVEVTEDKETSTSQAWAALGELPCVAPTQGNAEPQSSASIVATAG